MIKLVKSTFYQEEKTKRELCEFISKAPILSIGNECQKFERDFAKWQQRKFCIMVNSGSSANLALIQALLNLGKIRKGDNVGFSALTWSTNVMPIIQLGLQAIPIDIEIETLNISSRNLLDVIGKYPLKVLFITNVLGFCDDIDKIKEICDQKKIILIEDNCESLGTVYKKKKLGNYGLASTFSFYVGHHMSTIEGGAVCTNDSSLETMLHLVRAHGWDRNLTGKKQLKIRTKFKVNSTFYSRYTFYDLGYNFRTTEINGFLGNNQLQYIDEIIKKRQDNFHQIAQEIYKNTDRYYPVKYDHIDLVSNFAIPVVCKTAAIRDELVKKCSDRVEIRPMVGGDMVMQPFFHKYMPQFSDEFSNKNARLVHKQGLYFGNNPELTQGEIKEIIRIFCD